MGKSGASGVHEAIVIGNHDVLQVLVHRAARDHHYLNSHDFEGTPYAGSNTAG